MNIDNQQSRHFDSHFFGAFDFHVKQLNGYVVLNAHLTNPQITKDQALFLLEVLLVTDFNSRIHHFSVFWLRSSEEH